MSEGAISRSTFSDLSTSTGGTSGTRPDKRACRPPGVNASGEVRVAFLAGPGAFATPGGGEVQMGATAGALAGMGEEVRVLTGVEGDSVAVAVELRRTLPSPPTPLPVGEGRNGVPSPPTPLPLAGEGRIGAAPRPSPLVPAGGAVAHFLDRIDVLHLFGSRPEFVAVAEEARRRGVRVVVSTIAWFDLAGYWRGGRTLPGRVAASVRFLARAACPWLPSWRRRLYHAADLLLPNSKAEARQLIRYFGVRPERIRVVPNGADPRFGAARPEAFVGRYGSHSSNVEGDSPIFAETKIGTVPAAGMPSPPAPLPQAGEGRRGIPDFVFCPARIEPRKNQLDLIRAVRGTGLRLVILGDMVPGHEAYEARCRSEAGPEVTFLGRINHDDPLLASGYAACRCLALASWFETPGLAAIEAAMSGTPLVLPEGGAAREYFGDWAQYVRPGHVGEIRRALVRAAGQSRNPELARWTAEHYTWAAAARATLDAYKEVF